MTAKSLPTVGVVSLGCPKNLVDTEVMLGHLKKAGHEIVPDASARVVLVNTCGFIDRAKEESVEAILEQVERKKRGEIDRVDRRGLHGPEVRRGSFRARSRRSTPSSGSTSSKTLPPRRSGSPSLPRFTDKPLATRLYDELAPRVLVAASRLRVPQGRRGLRQPCTFCTIPQMRGLQRSRTIESLVAEARGLETQGVSELVLISQDTTRYGEDLGAGRDGLAKLVEALLAGTSFPWIRFLYAYPKTLNDSVLELMAREPRSSRTSTSRSSTSRARSCPRCAAEATGVVPPRCRADARAVPAIAIRTTFIVGFPGEGEAEFQSCASSCGGASSTTSGRSRTPRSRGRARSGWAILSRRGKGAAQGLPAVAPAPIARAKLRALKGSIVEAIVEGPSEEVEHLLEGRLRSQAPEIDGRLLINDAGDRVLFPGQIVSVKVERTFDYDVAGSVVGSP